MSTEEEEKPVDLREYWEILRKRKWVIGATFVLVVAGTWAFNMRQTPIYEATTSVVIEPHAPRVLANVEEVVPVGAGSFWSNADFYETEHKILGSRALASKVAERLGIAGVGADQILKQQHIQPVKLSKMVLIAYRDADPGKAAAMANAHAQAYIEYNLDRKLEGTKTAARWLAEQMGDLKDKLETSEMSMYTFKKDNRILAQSLDDRIELVKKNIEELAAQAQNTSTKRIVLKARIDEIERANKNEKLREALPDIASNTNVQSLSKLRMELDTQLVQLSQRYGDKYPKLAEVREQRDAVQARLIEEMDKITTAAQTEYRILQATETALNAELKRSATESLELNKLSVEHNKLRRETDNINRLYGVVMSRLKEADLTGLLRTNNVRVVDEAEAPKEPILPRTRNNVLLSALAGLVLGLLLALLLHFLDNTVKSQDDVQRMGLTFLGIIPNTQSTNEKERDLFVYHHQRSQVAECARAIRTSIMFMGADKPIQKILVVSARPVEGKTTAAITLATTMALSGSKTLLVDTDMRRPRLHKAFGLSSETGISSYLVGERTLDDVLKRTEIPDLDLLPCGPVPPAPAELIQSEKFKAMVEMLSKRYDRIVFDSPPIVAVTDAPVLSSLCDGVVFVVRVSKTAKDLVRRGLEQLHGANANVLGAVINDIDLDNRTYGYYYAYYRQYGNYMDGT